MKDRYYGQLIERKLDGSVDDALGSDSRVWFDNRLNRKNIGEYVRQRMESLNTNIGKNYIGFKIMFNNHELWRMIYE